MIDTKAMAYVNMYGVLGTFENLGQLDSQAKDILAGQKKPVSLCFSVKDGPCCTFHFTREGCRMPTKNPVQVLAFLLGLTVEGFYESLNFSFTNPIQAFQEFGSQSFGKVFTEGIDFSAYHQAHGTANLVLMIATTALAFCMVDMFDTLGTLYAVCERSGLLDEKGEPMNMNQSMLSDTIATTFGAICGTSTVTTFSEVNAGVAAGGRTGLTSVFCGIFFFIAMFLSPIAQLIPGCATAAALIYVGILMMGGVKNIDWSDYKISVPAFLTLAMMPFTYNISFGIAFGMIAYVVISTFCGDFKKIKASTWVITALFIAMLLLTR